MQWKKLIFFLFVGCFGLKIAYLDGDVQLQPAPSTINKTKRLQSTRFDALNDIHGLPGLEFRINSKGFLYASLLAGPIINNEIRRFQLQPLKQCFQQFNGCITISNLVISRYRCPQLVSLHPSPPNRLILIIRNLDLEIRANINGEIGVILPVKLNNTVYLRIHQISVTIQFTVQHTLNGSPYVRIVRCYVSTGLSDVFLQNDDFVGNIFNTYFRDNAASQVRKQLPIRVCKMMRDIVEKRINEPFRTMSKVVPLSKLSNFAKKAINSIKLADLPKHCRMQPCKERIHDHKTITHFPTSTANLNILSTDIKSTFTANGNTIDNRKSSTIQTKHTDNMHKISDTSSTHQLSSIHTKTLRNVTSSPILATSDMDVHQMDTLNFIDPCANCYSSNKSIPINNLDNVNKYIDEILPNVVLNMHLIKVFATPDYFQFGLRAAFGSDGKMDDAPLNLFPMHFPQFSNKSNKRMLDVLISDYTINSLLYHMHKNGAIMFHVGRETPKLNGLLKTTCNDEDYDDFNDFDANEDDEFDGEKNSTKTSAKFRKRRKRDAANDDNDNDKNHNVESKEEEDIFSDLGICIGDIMPAVREKYPKKLIAIKIYSTRIPTVTLLAENNGIARIDLKLEAVLYIDDSGETVGTILISSIIDGNVQISGNHVRVLIEIQSLKFVDKDDTLGLPSDALDNLANLSKDIIAQAANNELNGLSIELLAEKLPYNLVKPKFSIIDHAVHISTDFNIPASILGITSSTICRRF